MASIAIITARGGSKRIPKKNIKEFCGRPIIAYSIEAAINSNVFDEVMVSTDDEEIARIAKEYGAKVPFLRSEESANDFATTADVISEVLEEYEKLGRSFESFTCIYPTAPFVTDRKLKEASKLFLDSKSDGLMTVVPFSFPPQRGMVLNDGTLEYLHSEYEKSRSQDLPKIYHDCGQFYMCKVESFLKFKSLVMPMTIPFVIREEEAQDIDNLSDWVIAECKYQAMNKGK